MTDQSTTERIAELKKLAEAATPGPRKLERISGYHNVGIRVTGSLVSGYAAFLNTRWPHEGQRLEQEANARLIAATDPQTILSLIERIAELERKNAELVKALQQAKIIADIQRARIKRMEEQQNGFRPDFLLNGTRFKLNFSARGNVDVFHNYAKELQGRWVALVPAEDDKHLARPASAASHHKEDKAS